MLLCPFWGPVLLWGEEGLHDLQGKRGLDSLRRQLRPTSDVSLINLQNQLVDQAHKILSEIILQDFCSDRELLELLAEGCFCFPGTATCTWLQQRGVFSKHFRCTALRSGVQSS